MESSVNFIRPKVNTMTTDRGLEAQPVQRAMLLCHRPEDPVEEKESDSKVTIHLSVVIQGAVMNVVQTACPGKPDSYHGYACHPKITYMHPVMQVAKHEDGPAQQNHHHQQLVFPSHM